ncbi:MULTISPECIES: DinB family protein [Saccharothrix]|uniref:Damage-inducible protein DinB n=1 Tax=Saccharothrix yanglingensis TaxID=659496 RepID=A0ABU0X086_9PSEU|nr:MULTISPECIES: DinB family protein [Saccharothrix]MBY8848322.1 DinB family protein [Saccharothrix sp. MB29]MDQ2585417.1 damage-inducible protein DinB [Saccharothrix yanglingensis]MDU0294175.1 DinB family protein [Saccharothrix longispora]
MADRELLHWQFDLTWGLFEYHLERLVPGDHLWEPADLVWTIRDGVPDWAESEPDPVPVPTIAWVSWHIGWWWSVAIDHAAGRRPRDRAEVVWPGPERVVDWLRAMRDEWSTLLPTLDLTAPSTFPWPDRTVGHVVAWVNAELMKNVTEIGQLRLLRAAVR